MINLSTGAMSELFSVGKGTPMAVPLGDQQILLNRDQISVFVGYDGKITKKYGLTWSEVPLGIGTQKKQIKKIHQKLDPVFRLN